MSYASWVLAAFHTLKIIVASGCSTELFSGAKNETSLQFQQLLKLLFSLYTVCVAGGNGQYIPVQFILKKIISFSFFQLILRKAHVQVLQSQISPSPASLDFVLQVIHGCQQLSWPPLVLSGAQAYPLSPATSQTTVLRVIKAGQPTVSPNAVLLLGGC